MGRISTALLKPTGLAEGFYAPSYERREATVVAGAPATTSAKSAVSSALLLSIAAPAGRSELPFALPPAGLAAIGRVLV